MNFNKKIKIFLLSGFLLLILSDIFPQKPKEPKYLFKIASEAPDGSTWITNIRKIGKDLNTESKGEIGIVIYSGSIMGDQSTVIKKIKIGQLNGATFSSQGLSLIYKDFAVMGFPMVFKNYEEYDYVKEKMTSYYDDEFEKRDYILLCWTEVGLIYLFSKDKVNSVQTLKKSKPLLIEGDSISLALFNEIGTSPIPLQISDVMTGLQTGLIDTIFSSPYGLIAMQWFTKVNYMADFPITLMIGAVMIDSKLYNSMPENYRQKMKSAFRTTFDNLNQKVRDDNNNALTAIKKQGLNILNVPEQDQKNFNIVCNNVAKNLTEKEYSRDLLKKIEDHVDNFRKNKK